MRNAFYFLGIGVHTAASDPGFKLTIKRNCSISPKDLFGVLGAMTLIVLGIGVGFAWLGAWVILPFAAIEASALAAAFYLNGRHAADYERITLAEGKLTIEQCRAEQLERIELNPAWVRVEEHREGARYCVLLRSHGQGREIGRYLDPDRRASLAACLAHSCRVNSD